ncbi:MAG: hypothetical protein HXY44_04435 [Syntrophaceae bacterium]|nr:hypothetical protein [Syntrophaceae bacterium]
MNTYRKETSLTLCVVFSLTFFVASIAYAGGAKIIKTYPIPEHGVLELNVPITWQDKAHIGQENMPPIIIFIPVKGDDFKILITVLWGKPGEQSFNNPEKIRMLVELEGHLILPRAVETKLVVQQMRGVHNVGYFFTLTDKAPKPGEFLYLTRGGMAVGPLLLSVTILYRVEGSESLKEALTILREATHRIK